MEAEKPEKVRKDEQENRVIEAQAKLHCREAGSDLYPRTGQVLSAIRGKSAELQLR